MIEWEVPPTFAAGIVSASKLRVLSRGTEFLQGRADGPKSIFGGLQLMGGDIPADWTPVWSGWIQHYKDTLRYVVWGYCEDGGDDLEWKVIYGSNDLGIQYIGIHTTWTKHTGTLDLSTLGLTTGEWYPVSVQLNEAGSPSRDGFHLAMLREEEPISQPWELDFNSGSTEFTANETLTGATSGATGKVTRWYVTSGTWGGGDAAGKVHLVEKTETFQAEDLNGSVGGSNMASSTGAGAAVPTFSATEPNLESKLNLLSDHLAALKVVADMPDASLSGVSHYCSGSYDDIEWSDDRKWGGGCQHPGPNAKLSYAFESHKGGVQVKVYYTNEDGDWSEANHLVATIVLDTAETIVEGTIDVSGQASEGDWCRLRILGDRLGAGDGVFRMWKLVVQEDATSLSALQHWKHGRGLDFPDLNTLKNRISGLNPDPAAPDSHAKLSHWFNPVMKTVGILGFRVLVQRHHGFRYLHYRTPDEAPNSEIRCRIIYLQPGEGSWQEYTLDSEEPGWHVLDLEGLKNVLTPGVYYNLEDVDCGQEWTTE